MLLYFFNLSCHKMTTPNQIQPEDRANASKAPSNPPPSMTPPSSPSQKRERSSQSPKTTKGEPGSTSPISVDKRSKVDASPTFGDFCDCESDDKIRSLMESKCRCPSPEPFKPQKRHRYVRVLFMEDKFNSTATARACSPGSDSSSKSSTDSESESELDSDSDEENARRERKREERLNAKLLKSDANDLTK